MSDLKTLKDISTYQDVCGKIEKDGREFDDLVSVFDVRQEAIKWIKERISKCVYACRVGGIICKEHKFWMDRLNITEEDLK